MSKAKYRLKPDLRKSLDVLIPTMSHGLTLYKVLSIEESNGTPVANPLIFLQYSEGKAASYPQEFITLPLDALAELCENTDPNFHFWVLNKQYNEK